MSHSTTLQQAHDEVATFERALARLLHDGAVRSRFMTSETDADLPCETALALRDPDLCDLQRLGDTVRSRLEHRRHRGVGGLKQAFPQTFAGWAATGRRGAELIDAFIRHEAFEAWSAVPTARPGVSLEEAFFQFSHTLALVPQTTVLHEMAVAVAKALVVDPDPGFNLPKVFRGGPGRWFAILEGPTLVAACRGALLQGPITPLLADLLKGVEIAQCVERHGIEAPAIEVARNALVTKGLLLNASGSGLHRAT